MDTDKHRASQSSTAPTNHQSPDSSIRPEWLRPKAVQPCFGIGRTKLYQLIAEGRVKTVSLRHRGQKHGTRLISYDSLAEYLDGLTEGGAK